MYWLMLICTLMNFISILNSRFYWLTNWTYCFKKWSDLISFTYVTLVINLSRYFNSNCHVLPNHLQPLNLDINLPLKREGTVSTITDPGA